MAKYSSAASSHLQNCCLTGKEALKKRQEGNDSSSGSTHFSCPRSPQNQAVLAQRFDRKQSVLRHCRYSISASRKGPGGLSNHFPFEITYRLSSIYTKDFIYLYKSVCFSKIFPAKPWPPLNRANTGSIMRCRMREISLFMGPMLMPGVTEAAINASNR